MSDSSEKTEKATPKRLKEARQKGKLSSSRDVIGWVTVAGAALMMPAVLSSARTELTMLVEGFGGVIADPEAAYARNYLLNALEGTLPIIAPLLASALVGTIVGTLVQGGIHFKQFKFSFEHFDLVKGVGRIFGRQALWEGAKSLLKTGVVGVAVWMAMQGVLPLLSTGNVLTVPALAATAMGVIGTLLQATIVAGLLIGAVDMFVVMRRNRKHTMMTRQEMKDEMKQSDGNPQMRAARRSRALAISRNRMMSAIGEADVVLLNPTHIAVALKYEPGKSAPRVIAKGQGEIAAKIRERAAELRVPMVENIPLARALHAACDVGQEIPEDLYAAVAKVLAFVMALKRRGAALGVHRLAS
jgi:flagellar biosynthesis protein FlhB